MTIPTMSPITTNTSTGIYAGCGGITAYEYLYQCWCLWHGGASMSPTASISLDGILCGVTQDYIHLCCGGTLRIYLSASILGVLHLAGGICGYL